ncbi:MAG: hypothetical protein N3A60_10730, partial [Thermanaerothrix sp.]|nr:hypothetical protein [Thermanaerothrix sp.]
TQPGAYFVTLCTHQRGHLFGAVVEGTMVLNPYGKIVGEEWFRTAVIRPYVRLDSLEFVVMPNHIHGIIWLETVGAEYDEATHVGAEYDGAVGATRRVAPTRGAIQRVAPTRTPNGPAPGSIGAIIGQFKSIVTKRINVLRGTPGAPVWQRNYYEHIIRDERALATIRHYIAENPIRWALDHYNPASQGNDPLAAEIWRFLSADTPSQGETR